MKLNFEKLKSPAIKKVIVKQQNKLNYLEYTKSLILIKCVRCTENGLFKLDNYEN